MNKGFLSLPLAGALAAGAVILGLALALKVQGARLDAAQADLEACTTRYKETLMLVDKQNKAVAQLETESQKRARNAAAALAKARQGQGSLSAEIARLKGINAGLLDCSGAVEQVKRGMK